MKIEFSTGACEAKDCEAVGNVRRFASDEWEGALWLCDSHWYAMTDEIDADERDSRETAERPHSWY